jgi:hypothetical protein
MFFTELWEQLRNRVDAAKPSLGALRESVLEFNSLVTNYSRYLACPVYERVPSKLSSEMLKVYNFQGVGNDLIQFRERFDRFYWRLHRFSERLGQKITVPAQPWVLL